LTHHHTLVEKRDDLYLEYITLLNSLGHHHEAISKLLTRTFHPWEVGECKVTGQYVFAHVELVKKALQDGEFFAVSLPDFLVFEDDLNKRNTIHCLYMRGLGLIGLNKYEQAKIQLDEVLRLESNHQGAHIYRQMFDEQLRI
jgi:hypothetical protein